jgi:hypothetical protein
MQSASCHRAAIVPVTAIVLDRLPSNDLTMTQELINTLGLRREGVTEATSKLQKVGVIEKNRGHITVLNRAELERLCCECYAVVKRECDRLLPEPDSTEGGAIE